MSELNDTVKSSVFSIKDIEDTLPYRFDSSPIKTPRKEQFKFFSKITKTLKERGFNTVTNDEIIKMLKLLFDMNESEILQISTNETMPYMIRVICQAILNNETSIKSAFDLLRLTLIDNERIKVSKKQVGLLKVKKGEDDPLTQLAKSLYPLKKMQSDD